MSNSRQCKLKNHNENFQGFRPHIIIVKVCCGRHYELYMHLATSTIKKQSEIFIILKKTPQKLTTYNSTKLLGCQMFKIKKEKRKKLLNVSKLLKEKGGHQKMWN